MSSPEDHAILEAEYQRNPKPDRAARANIVGRVALGDKEVQVCGPPKFIYACNLPQSFYQCVSN